MSDKRIVVTGAGGFIGGHMSRFLKEKGYWVRGVDIKPHRWMRKDEFCDEFLLLDLTRYENVVESVRGVDEVYNFAANMGGIGFIMTCFADVMRDSVSINTNVAEACRRMDVDKVFFSSSACVYPEYLQDRDYEELDGKYVLAEKDAFPADPDSFYGWEKLFAEQLYWSYYLDYGLDIRIARFHNIQGIYTEWEEPRCKAPAALSRKIAMLPPNGGTIEVWGDGKQVRTFLDVRDCCEAVYRLMQIRNEKIYKLGVKNKPRPPAINIGSDEETTINNLIDMISDIAYKKVKKRCDLTKPQGVRSRSADLSNVKEIICWEPKYRLRNTMEWLFNWVNKEINK